MNIFETSFRRGKFDASRKLANGGMLDFTHIYPMDAVFDTPEDVPEEVRGVCCRGWVSVTILWGGAGVGHEQMCLRFDGKRGGNVALGRVSGRGWLSLTRQRTR